VAEWKKQELSRPVLRTRVDVMAELQARYVAGLVLEIAYATAVVGAGG